MARKGLGRARAVVRAAPLPVKLALIVVVLLSASFFAPILLTAGLAYGPVAVWLGRRSFAASASAGLWGVCAVAVMAMSAMHQANNIGLLVLPVATVAVAHIGPLARRFPPCRTVAWASAWSLPPALLAWWLDPGQPYVSVIAGWLLAAVAVFWRLARAWQASQAEARQLARGAASAGRAGRGSPRLGRAGSGPAVGAVAARGADGAAPPKPAALGSAPQLPAITVDEALADLDAMIGLDGVKAQIRQLTASVEAARRRAQAGYPVDKPMQHLVFLGPPGTGKTSVARILATIYYACGLLETPNVVEAQRADLVGEYLGATAIKTNDLIDAALGGVLFIDEAYSLVNNGEGQNDRFGNEAVQALLKRAEDERDGLLIILAGYERQMEDFLASNPGLNSRFPIRIKFSGYNPDQLQELARATLAQRGESLASAAQATLASMMADVGRRRLADELGNGRFVRNLLEKAGQVRDVRVMADAAEPTPTELVTLEVGDLEQAFADLTSRFRGYAEPPTLASALAELDELVGLEPVKRQVHEIAAQLRVARLRDRQGLASQPPVRHFVFTGPPGTGKTTVARILGRIFAALGLLVRPEVVEAHRADLVGEHLGSTAIKTSKLIDSALGGVLFIDEAYSLYNTGYGGGDAYGAEAIATLLKRAEDDRERLVIVLAGYPADMDRLLGSNPGLKSRFNLRIDFPSFTPGELARIAATIAQRSGDCFDAGALTALSAIFREACDRGRIDELGNGRFARSLYERACAARDLRVAELEEDASPADLTTVTAADLATAAAELAP